jgi:hypothetical protein
MRSGDETDNPIVPKSEEAIWIDERSGRIVDRLPEIDASNFTRGSFPSRAPQQLSFHFGRSAMTARRWCVRERHRLPDPAGSRHRITAAGGSP